MKNNKKIKYEAPTIEVMIVELEQGIAAASVTVTIGTPADSFTPQVNDWQNTDLPVQNGDL